MATRSFENCRPQFVVRMLRSLSVLAIVSALSACGGDGSGSSETELTTACAATTTIWRVDGSSCTASLPQGAPNKTVELQDQTTPATGTARYICDAGVWKLDQSTVAATCAIPNEPEQPTEPEEPNQPEQPVDPNIQQLDLHLSAAADGRWYEYFSDVFSEIGHEWNGGQQKDGYFLIGSLPDHVAIGSGVDQFPLEGDWHDFGTVSYNIAGYNGVGVFEAPITAIVADLNPFVRGEVSTLAASYTTRIEPVSSAVPLGVVLFNNGDVVGIELNATIVFTWPAGNPFDNSDLQFSGPFTIARDGNFVLTAGEVSDAATAASDLTKAARWEFSGSVVDLVTDPLETCAQTVVSWSSAGNSCSANLAQALAGSITNASDSIAPAVGSAVFRCDAGNWVRDETTTPAVCNQVMSGTRTFALGLSADANGRWYEYISDAFTEIGYAWNGSQQKDGFFRIDRLPDHVTIGSGIDHYPSEGSWSNFGTVTYNVTGYTGIGTFEAPITMVAANLNPYVLGEQSVLNQSYSTAVSQATGVVLLNNGAVVGLELNSTIAFTWINGNYLTNGDLVFTGPFTIARDGRFVLTAGEISDAATAATDPTKAARWEFSGSVMNLP